MQQQEEVLPFFKFENEKDKRGFLSFKSNTTKLTEMEVVLSGHSKVTTDNSCKACIANIYAGVHAHTNVCVLILFIYVHT